MNLQTDSELVFVVGAGWRKINCPSIRQFICKSTEKNDMHCFYLFIYLFIFLGSNQAEFNDGELGQTVHRPLPIPLAHGPEKPEAA